MTDSIPGRVCRPSRLEFARVFSETRLNTEGQPPPARPDPLWRQLALIQQPTNQRMICVKNLGGLHIYRFSIKSNNNNEFNFNLKFILFIIKTQIKI